MAQGGPVPALDAVVGETFDEERCACAESCWGWTVPVTAHPAGASPFGAEQLAGNV